MLHEDKRKNYKDLVEAHNFTHIGSWEMDMVQNKSCWSEEACRIYGVSFDQYDGTYESFINIIHPEDRARVDNKITSSVNETNFDLEYRIIRPDGIIRNIRQLIIPIYNQEGKLIYLYGNIQDFSGRIEFQSILGQTEATIDRMQRRFQVLVQQSSDVFEIISPDYTILYISPAIEEITGFSAEEWSGRNALEFLETEYRQVFIRKIEHVLDCPEERSMGDLILKNRNGDESYVTYTISNQLSESSIQGIIINWRDITDRIKNQKELEFIATHDELTKLPNRVYLKQKITQLCEESSDEDFALIMLDIDGFRYVNDALGYQLGDQLILLVADRLKVVLGEDRFICRYSGDQFAIIIQNLHKSWEYEQTVKKIAELFKEPYKVDLYELDMTVSLGISMYPNDEKDPDLLINYANISLLRSKHEGKNRYKFYSSDIGIQIYKQVVLRNDLLKAIERDQFQVYYQAQVRLESNDILAAEALIRWEHPEWGMVSPNEFIALAEETGFVINLGNWMLREVCKNYRKWLEEGRAPIKISVNYSSIQFFERNFVENILNIINEFGLDPHFLIMEITESVFMKNPERRFLI